MLAYSIEESGNLNLYWSFFPSSCRVILFLFLMWRYFTYADVSSILIWSLEQFIECCFSRKISDSPELTCWVRRCSINPSSKKHQDYWLHQAIGPECLPIFFAPFKETNLISLFFCLTWHYWSKKAKQDSGTDLERLKRGGVRVIGELSNPKEAKTVSCKIWKDA